MKKIIICFLFISILFFIIFQQNIYASSIDGTMKDADDWLKIGESDSPINEVKLKESSDYVFNTLLTIGILATFIVACTLGIQFMMGSVEEQAKIKESLKPFIIGCIILFGAFGIWKIILTVLGSV